MRTFQGVVFWNSARYTLQSGGPMFRNYSCGWCHTAVDGRMVAKWDLPDGSVRMLCACSCGGPTALAVKGGDTGPIIRQSPAALDFRPGPWPDKLRKLFEEASLAYSADANTACTMVCRKILMACACEQGDTDGQSFAHYVDYITTQVLTYPKAKASIDQIRQIGNDANHDVTFVTKPDAEKAMRIITYLLDALYAFPEAHAAPAAPVA